jgi:hypothetical protein
MIAKLTSSHVQLAPSGLLSIEGRAGLTVACEAGLVWVTVEGESVDHWLVAGEAFALAWPGRVVVEAAQASRVALREPGNSIRQMLARVWSPRFAGRRGAIAKENMA